MDVFQHGWIFFQSRTAAIPEPLQQLRKEFPYDQVAEAKVLAKLEAHAEAIFERGWESLGMDGVTTTAWIDGVPIPGVQFIHVRLSHRRVCSVFVSYQDRVPVVLGMAQMRSDGRVRDSTIAAARNLSEYLDHQHEGARDRFEEIERVRIEARETRNAVEESSRLEEYTSVSAAAADPANPQDFDFDVSVGRDFGRLLQLKHEIRLAGDDIRLNREGLKASLIEDLREQVADAQERRDELSGGRWGRWFVNRQRRAQMQQDQHDASAELKRLQAELRRVEALETHELVASPDFHDTPAIRKRADLVAECHQLAEQLGHELLTSEPLLPILANSLESQRSGSPNRPSTWGPASAEVNRSAARVAADVVAEALATGASLAGPAYGSDLETLDPVRRENAEAGLKALLRVQRQLFDPTQIGRGTALSSASVKSKISSSPRTSVKAQPVSLV